MKTISKISEQGLMAGGLKPRDIDALEKVESEMKMVKKGKFFDKIHGGLKK